MRGVTPVDDTAFRSKGVLRTPLAAEGEARTLEHSLPGKFVVDQPVHVVGTAALSGHGLDRQVGIENPAGVGQQCRIFRQRPISPRREGGRRPRDRRLVD